MNNLKKVRVMKIVDGKCPYCSQVVNEKPGKAAKQINCVNCGRLLNLPPKGGVKVSVRSGGDLQKTFEPGLVFSTLVGLAFSSGSLLLTAIFGGLGMVVMVLLWTNEDIPGLPESLKERAEGSAERIRVFPFELYLVLFWVALLVFNMANFYHLAGYTLCLMMFFSSIDEYSSNSFSERIQSYII